ncbi:L-aspartate oxidase [Candidatus Acetothermia bacterium]|nr:L-aspartate oxidase [Candidatus Acetothermia bacterium]MBI3643969.1 L-aspartate oxidase [Candidatus Acetothermia bacterium]
MRSLRDLTLKTEVLVIGGGAAGLVAALTAAKRSKVLLLAKSPVTESSSAWAQGGIAAAISSEDSPAQHFADTIKAGRGLCDERAVELLVNEAPRAINLLIEWGTEFDRTDGRLSLGREGGHSQRRIVHARGSATGAAVVEALFTRVKNHSNIQLVEGPEVIRLLTQDNLCAGVLAFDSEHEQSLWIRAGAVILATGGASDLYLRRTNPVTSSGSGIALAYDADAEIQDIELIQFHPTALSDAHGSAQLISEAVRGEGAYLLDAHNQRFMPEIHELAELAPRDIVARAIHKQIETTGGVYLSLRHLDSERVQTRFPSLVEACRERGFDFAHDLIPIAPAAHYTIGGVRTDLRGATNIDGLFACGEVACTGVHGANRLASNSLLECVVFGERAGHEASKLVALHTSLNGSGIKDVDNSLDFVLQVSQPEILEMQDQLKQIMTNEVGLFRSQAGLISALTKIAAMRESLNRATQSIKSLRLKQRLQTAELIARAALEREETRGTHARVDFPKEDPKWQRHILLRQERELCSTR